MKSHEDLSAHPTDSADQLEQLVPGEVALVALQLVEHTNTSMVDVETLAASLQRHGQLEIATGWVENKKLFLSSGKRRARASVLAGLSHLRVEIISKPDSSAEYLRSRAANVHTKVTSLDDAVRWKELIGDGTYKNDADLASALDIPLPVVRKTLSINMIPMRLLHRMAESPLTSSLQVASQFCRIFSGKAAKRDPKAAEKIAEDLINETNSRSLSIDELKSLIRSRVRVMKRLRRPIWCNFTYGKSKVKVRWSHDRSLLRVSFGSLPQELQKMLMAKLSAEFAGILSQVQQPSSLDKAE